MATNRIYPQLSFISGITNAQRAVATFTEDHDFIVGQIVSFNVTPAFGMFQIQGKKGKILSLTSDTITVDIDTTTWDAFDYSVLDDPGTTPPTCVPCSSGVLTSEYTPYVIFADAFDNRKA